MVCLLSALQFHELTTQAPFEVWLAIDEKARLPKVDYPSLRVVRFSGPALENGIKEHRIEGVAVKVYTPAKTVADCFKYRNKIGLDVALEALRDCWKKRRATMDELWQAAKTCRVAKRHAPLPGVPDVTKQKPRNLAASVRQRLMNLARTQKEDFRLILTRYALERLLYRLSQAIRATFERSARPFLPRCLWRCQRSSPAIKGSTPNGGPSLAKANWTPAGRD